jgi:23S rRNA (cytidine2498-2'-O)-methyltransferase
LHYTKFWLTMSRNPAQFVFMTCRTGAEGALKAEVARTEPMWRLAFSRPGFLTWKVPSERPVEARQLAERNWTLAHTHGISLGRLAGTELSSLLDQLWGHDGLVASGMNPPPSGISEPFGETIGDVHVWQREQHAPDDPSVDAIVTPLALEIDQAIRDAAPESCAKLRKRRASSERPPGRRRPTEQGALVLDIVLIEPGEWWVGCHRAITSCQRWAGGAIPVRMPAHAVSRAYVKLEEALAWSELPLTPGDECVEIGCAPGGASQALLDHGLFVTGVDPADVDPAVLEYPRFRHLRKRGHEVRRKEFVGVRWLAADMNIAPDATLDTVEAIVTHPGVSIRGLILTLKFADWSDAGRLGDFAKRVRGWGYRDVRVRQLVTGGQEVCLAALRRKTLRRLGRKPSRKQQPRSRVDSPHSLPPKPHC